MVKITCSLPRKSIAALIKGYRYFISPLLGNNCRFNPSCAQYAYDAILAHGVLRGGFLTLRRVLRCHPWSVGGNDPVPSISEK